MVTVFTSPCARKRSTTFLLTSYIVISCIICNGGVLHKLNILYSQEAEGGIWLRGIGSSFICSNKIEHLIVSGLSELAKVKFSNIKSNLHESNNFITQKLNITNRVITNRKKSYRGMAAVHRTESCVLNIFYIHGVPDNVSSSGIS